MKRFVARLVLLAVSSLLCLAVAELAVRVVAPQNVSIWAHTPEGLVVLRSNVRGHVTARGKLFETNSMGLRDREHARTKPPGTYRILVLGDSFMEATQVAWEDSLPALLERELEAGSGRTVEVINAGVSGWGTDDHLTWFECCGRALAPDLVLVAMTLHNDVFDNLQQNHHYLDAAGELVRRPPPESSLRLRLRLRLQEWIAGSSHLYQLVAGSLRAEQVRVDARQLDRLVAELLAREQSLRLEAGWDLTLRLLDRLVEEARAIGAETAVFLIPLAVQVTESRLDAFADSLGVPTSSLDPLRPQEIMRAWGTSRSVQVIDLLPPMRDWARRTGVDPYLPVDGHWDEQGHAVAARIVAAELGRERSSGDERAAR